MDNFFQFINLIKDEIFSLLAVVPWYISTTVTVALTFVIVLAVMRIVALIEDDIPFV